MTCVTFGAKFVPIVLNKNISKAKLFTSFCVYCKVFICVKSKFKLHKLVCTR